MMVIFLIPKIVDEVKDHRLHHCYTNVPPFTINSDLRLGEIQIILRHLVVCSCLTLYAPNSMFIRLCFTSVHVYAYLIVVTLFHSGTEQPSGVWHADKTVPCLISTKLSSLALQQAALQ